VRLTRVYVDEPLASGSRVTLGGSAAGHLTRVLRLRPGEALTLFNGTGGEFAAGIDTAHGGKVTAVVGEHLARERESGLELTLAQGVSRGERMDLVLQKATELGVTAVVPLLTERSVVRLDERQAQRKLAHWRAIAIAACEQCGRNRLPQLTLPQGLGEFLRGPAAGAMRLLLSPMGTATLNDLKSPASVVTVLIGPEGGLTDAEQEAAVAAGFTAVRLGPRVLRTETAALAAVTLLQRQFGDL
jgi:16S rRNA (uracil1498-N3)-methyltransferase